MLLLTAIGFRLVYVAITVNWFANHVYRLYRLLLIIQCQQL